MNINYILTFVAGMGVGAGITYLVMSRTPNEKVISDTEIEEVEVSNEASNIMRHPYTVAKAKAVRDISKDDGEMIMDETAKDILAQSRIEEIESDLDDIIEENVFDSFEEEEHSLNGDPYFITEEDFNDTKPAFDKLSYTLYSDGVIADMMDEPVDMDGSLVSDMCGEAFRYGMEETLFVRDEKNNSDYEIFKSHMTFDEATGAV